MNKTIMTIIAIIVIIGAIIIGVQICKPNKEQEDIITKVSDEKIEDDCTDEYQEIQEEMLQTNSTEEKISPNCFITMKKKYNKCGHTTSEYIAIPKELVNKTKEDLEEKYTGWTIDKFSDTQIVISKKEEGECGEHYIVKDKDGKVVIYKLLEDGTENEYEVTDISTEYITDTDKINMKNGIKVNGKQELNQLIEDFE
ncbi:MAG: BofC C-terminal domain-containing protein [Clostridia bacterium]|jgi:hypothetical protein